MVSFADLRVSTDGAFCDNYLTQLNNNCDRGKQSCVTLNLYKKATIILDSGRITSERHKIIQSMCVWALSLYSHKHMIYTQIYKRIHSPQKILRTFIIKRGKCRITQEIIILQCRTEHQRTILI